MIRDARVLRAGFVPREVEHRDAEVNHLFSVLEPITNGEPADTAIVTGPSGTGKTCISQFVTERLREEVLDVEAIYINCWRNYTRFRTLYRILDNLGATIDIHRQSTPHNELVDRLQQHDGPRTVIILDEGVITDDQLYRIADAAAGDVRLAIGILRTAAGKADREKHERITDDILLDAAEDARAQTKQKSLDSLTPHQWVVHEIVRKHGPLEPSEIHERYSEDIEDPRTKRTIRTYLSKMEQYNLLEAEGTSRDREYSVVDSAAASPA